MIRTFTAAAILVLTASAAQAGPAVVRFGDLDLSRPSDNRILTSRVQTAAQATCADRKPEGSQKTSLFYKTIYKNCIATTSRSLTSQVMALSGHVTHLAGN